MKTASHRLALSLWYPGASDIPSAADGTGPGSRARRTSAPTLSNLPPSPCSPHAPARRWQSGLGTVTIRPKEPDPLRPLCKRLARGLPTKQPREYRKETLMPSIRAPAAACVLLSRSRPPKTDRLGRRGWLVAGRSDQGLRKQHSAANTPYYFGSCSIRKDKTKENHRRRVVVLCV